MIQFLLLQFIAHLLADFFFQPQHWSNIKSGKVITSHHIYHVLVVFVFSFLLSFDLGFLKSALLLTGLHLLIDITKSYLQLKAKQMKNRRNYFFVDQLFHLLALIVISAFYFQNNPVHQYLYIPFNFVVLTATFALCAKPTNIIIKNIFIVFNIETPLINRGKDLEEDEDLSLPNAGKIIGVMERFLVLALIIVGQYSAVGLIIAAKSILRYRSTQKNEYVLVGTLLSFGIATLLAMLISKFLMMQ